MVTIFPAIFRFLACCLIAFGCGGCLMQRTVTENGRVVSEDYVVDRPIRDAIRAGNE